MTSPGHTPIYHFISPLYLEKIEKRVSEGGTIKVLIVMTQRGKICFKRHKDCETGCINIHSDPENPIHEIQS